MAIGDDWVSVNPSDSGENPFMFVISGCSVCADSAVIHVAVSGKGSGPFVFDCIVCDGSPSVVIGRGDGPDCGVVLAA